MALKKGCPPREVLSAFVAGELAEDRSNAVLEHVETCEDCEATVEQLERRGDPFLKQLRTPVGADPYHSEPGCDRVVKRAAAIAGASIASDAAADWSQEPGMPTLGTIQEYELLEKLGAGGMGTVYKAWHTKLKRAVALKVLPKHRLEHSHAVARFGREMAAVGGLEHPHIVRALHAGEDQGQPYLVMELVEGPDLSQLLKRWGPLSSCDACELIRQAAIGLQYAHQHGMVHRDIKPSNLMLTAASREQFSVIDHDSARGAEAMAGPESIPLVKILDLGLALLGGETHASSGDLTSNGQIMGTRNYMAPEQASDSHKVDIRADIYGLGATLYTLLCGRVPVQPSGGSTPPKLQRAVLQENLACLCGQRPRLPKGLLAILKKMMAWQPDQRFNTPAEVAGALEPFCKGCDLIALLAPPEPAAPETVRDQVAVSTASDRTSLSERGLQGAGPARSRRSWLAALPRLPSQSRIITLGLAAGLLFALGVVIFLHTGEGRVEITVNEPDVDVTIDGQERPEIQIHSPRDAIDVTLPAGKHVMQVTKDGFSTETNEFRVVRYGKTELSVTLTRQPDAVEKQPSPAKTVPTEPKTAFGWKPGKPLPKPKLVPIQIKAEPRTIQPGEPLSKLALVTNPAPIPGVCSWTIETIGHRGWANHAFSPDGGLLATHCGDGTIRLWDAATGSLVKALVGHHRALMHGHCGQSCLTWSPDGKYLASGGPETIRFWSVEQGQLLRTMTLEALFSLAWSPDGRALAFGGWRGLLVRELATGKELLRVHTATPTTRIMSVTWSPDGKALAFGDNKGTLQVWDLLSEDARRRYPVIEGNPGGIGVRVLAWSPDGGILASCDTEQTRLWDAKTGKPWRYSPPLDDVICFAWAPEGRNAAITYRRSLPSTWEAQGIETWTVTHAQTTPNSKWLEAAWPSGSGLLHYGPDGQTIATSIGLTRDSLVEIRDLRRPSQVRLLPWQPWGSAVTFAPDGKTLVSAHQDRTLRFWEAASGQSIHQQELGLFHAPQTLAFSPDGQVLAIGESIHKVILLDTKSRQSVGELSPGAGGLAWSPDGKKLAAGAEHSRGKVAIYDVALRQQSSTFSCSYPSGVLDLLAWSPDGARLAARCSGAPRAYVWDAGSGRSLCDFEPKSLGINLFWREQNTLISAEDRFYENGAPRCLATYDAQSGKLLRTVPKPVGTLSPDGQVYVTSEDSMIRVVRMQDDKSLYTIVPLREGKHITVSPEGHYRGSPGVEKDLVYVVQTDEGQQTLTPAEFSKRFGWKNDPSKVSPVTRPPSQPEEDDEEATVEDASEPQFGWKPGKPLPKPKAVETKIEPEPLGNVKPGEPLSRMALVTNPASIEGVRSWTVETVGHRAVVDVAFSPNGKLLGTNCGDGTVRIWDTANATLLKAFLGQRSMLTKRLYGSPCITWSPDEQHFATGAADGIYFWDARSGRRLRRVSTVRGPVCRLAWSPDGRALAEANRSALELWNPVSGELLSSKKGSNTNVFLAWSPDGRKLASHVRWNDDRQVELWDFDQSSVGLSSRDVVGPLARRAQGVAFSPDGQVLAAFSPLDMCFYEAQTGRPWKLFPHTDRFSLLAWSPDGRRALGITVRGRAFEAWNVETGTRQYYRLKRKLSFGTGTWDVWRSPKLSPTHDTMAVPYKRPVGQVELWKSSTGDVDCQLPWHPVGHDKPFDPGHAFAFSPNGNTLAVGLDVPCIELWSADLSGTPQRLALAGEPVAVAFSPDSSRLAVALDYKQYKVQVWDLLAGRAAKEIGVPCPLALAWSPTGDRLAVSTSSDGVGLYDVNSGDRLRTLAVGDFRFSALAWHPDGQTLAIAGDASGNNHVISVWDVTSPRQQRGIESQGYTEALFWSDEHTVVSCERSYHQPGSPWKICEYDVHKGSRVSERPGSFAAVSPDRQLAVLPYDSMIRLARFDNCQPLATLVPLRNQQHVVIAPNGHYRGSPAVEKELVYVAQLPSGEQVTLSAEEFSERFGWKNDSSKATLDIKTRPQQ